MLMNLFLYSLLSYKSIHEFVYCGASYCFNNCSFMYQLGYVSVASNGKIHLKLISAC